MEIEKPGTLAGFARRRVSQNSLAEVCDFD
jgi:hypothetical protein